MDDNSINTRDPRFLASLLGGEDKIWGEQDLAAILRHQLDAPLHFDLRRLGTDSEETVLRTTRGSPRRLETFADLFAHPDPPLDLLRLTKEFGKTVDSRAQGMVPQEVAKVLYYAAIVTARLRLGMKISDLSDTDLATGCQWVLRKAWLDPTLRPLFADALSILQS